MRGGGLWASIRIAVLCAALTPLDVAQAGYLQLDFEVDVDRYYNGDIASPVDPDIRFNYTVYVNLASLDSREGTYPNGADYASTWFPASITPPSRFSSEVMANVTQDVPLFDITSVYRELVNDPSSIWYGSTFEGITFGLYGYSSIEPEKPYDFYQRSVQLNGHYLPNNQVKNFTPITFSAYMKSMVGVSVFHFDEIFATATFPDGVPAGEFEYGYSGLAKITAATPIDSIRSVPLPPTLLLVFSGLASLGLLKWRKKPVS